MSNVTRTPILRSLRVAAAILVGRAQLTHTQSHARDRQSRRPITSQITLKLTPVFRRLGVGSAPLLGSKLALVGRASISCVRRRCVPLPTSGRRCQIVYARVHYFTQACTSPAGRPASRARIITSPCGRSCLTANYLTSTYNHWPLWAISHTYLSYTARLPVRRGSGHDFVICIEKKKHHDCSNLYVSCVRATSLASPFRYFLDYACAARISRSVSRVREEGFEPRLCCTKHPKNSR
ncbi:unnamed protein product [Trichogramma brassicae]|uniref:Uncharacterized protein n=1 Tax=Trichogramma brassicae TaxID=86971 RepID=A0A6H5IUR7_9HYME|nr:unnamed protein product [Trichogramma brassicae]